MEKIIWSNLGMKFLGKLKYKLFFSMNFIRKQCASGRIEIVNFMLENIENIDLAYKDNSPIVLASQYCHFEVVKRLMKSIFSIYIFFYYIYIFIKIFHSELQLIKKEFMHRPFS